MKKILIVDDEKNIREPLAEFLELEGYSAEVASNGLSAVRLLEQQPFSAVVLDLKMPGMDGIGLLNWCQTSGIDIPLLMMSAFGEVEDAVLAMKMGACDYLVKPFDPQDLTTRLGRLSLGEIDDPSPSENADTHSPIMLDVYRLVEKAAPGPSTILITGESGTGKEVLARRIHQLSGRGEAPFVPVNMGGVPETLLESELFGYEKGAFTGADRRKLGLFEEARGGTLLLDEIGDIPLSLQVKLLRVLQERQIRRLGGTGIIPVDVRIVAATHKDLEALVASGEFREDLFYRINVIRVELPPLRQRPEDLPALCRSLLAEIARRFDKPLPRITTGVWEVLRHHSFPGNIRELNNLLERAYVMSSREVITEADIRGVLPFTGDKSTEKETAEERPLSLKEMEKQAIIRSLLRWDGRRGKTAEELGINRRTLLNKIKEYEIDIN